MTHRQYAIDVGKLIGYIIAGAVMLTSSTQAGAHGAEQSPAANEHHQHEFPGAIQQFHQLLAPLWHSQPGRDRVDAACNRATQLHTLAQNIASATVPERAQRDTAGWNKAVEDMIVSIDRLSRACGERGAADAEAALVAAQRAFHDMVAYLGHGH
jgi:hypothetical protein